MWGGEHDELATPSTARAEYARNAGSEDPARAWVLTPWDTWEPNPHYQGPPVRHPESDPDDWDPEPPVAWPGDAAPVDDDWPF